MRTFTSRLKHTYAILLACTSLTSSWAESYFVSAGNGAHLLSSKDGITWENHTFKGKPGHDHNDMMAIAHGNGVTVAVGGYGKSNIYLTKDGAKWEKIPFNISAISGCLFVDGRFAVFSQMGTAAESPDGIKWTKKSSANVRAHIQKEAQEKGLKKPIKSHVREWAYASGTFLGVGDNGVLVTTKDLETFSFPPRIENVKRLRVTSDGNHFVVVDGVGGKYAGFSKDGITWKEITPKLSEKEKVKNVQFDGNRFILEVNDRGLESPDGENWKPITDATFPGNLVALPQAYFSVGPWYNYTKEPKVSFDKGKTWKTSTFPEPAAMRVITHVQTSSP